MTGFLIIAALIVTAVAIIAAINVWCAKKYPGRELYSASSTEHNVHSPSMANRSPFAR